MIKFHPSESAGSCAVELSPAVAKALLEFASRDKTRPHLCAVGINSGDLCATDGYTALRFKDCGIPESYTGRIFPRAYVETELKAGIARKTNVFLYFDNLSHETLKFPTLQDVEPKDRRVNSEDATGIDSTYLGRLALVAKACKGDSAGKQNGVLLVSLTGALNPIGFEVGHNHGDLNAFVTIMPMRL